MKKQKIYHLNDRTMKYLTLKQCRRQHYYLGLPREFEARYPQEIVFPDMTAGRADEFYSTKEGLLIDLEEESGDITDRTLGKFAEYAIFAEFMYSRKAYVAVICKKDPKKKFEWYEKSPSIYIKIHYIHFTQTELWEKYENIINKVEQNIELTENEALDIAFVPKFISEDDGEFITESLATNLKHAIIPDEELKRDVTVLLAAMILKHVKNAEKINKLMEEINMKQVDEDIKIIAREEYKDEIDKVKKEVELAKKEAKIAKEEANTAKQNETIAKQEQENMKKEIKKLLKIPDLAPEAQKIINGLLLVKK